METTQRHASVDRINRTPSSFEFPAHVRALPQARFLEGLTRPSIRSRDFTRIHSDPSSDQQIHQLRKRLVGAETALRHKDLKLEALSRENEVMRGNIKKLMHDIDVLEKIISGI